MKKQCNLKPPAPCFLPVLSRMAGCTLADPGIHGHMVSYVETLVGRQVCGEGPRTLGVGCDSWATILLGYDPCFGERLSVAYPEGRYRARIPQHVFVGDRLVERVSVLVCWRSSAHG